MTDIAILNLSLNKIEEDKYISVIDKKDYRDFDVLCALFTSNRADAIAVDSSTIVDLDSAALMGLAIDPNTPIIDYSDSGLFKRPDHRDSTSDILIIEDNFNCLSDFLVYSEMYFKKIILKVKEPTFFTIVGFVYLQGLSKEIGEEVNEDIKSLLEKTLNFR